jgi:hypothetical protein
MCRSACPAAFARPSIYAAKRLCCGPGEERRDPTKQFYIKLFIYNTVILVAGTLEPFFLDNAARWAAALRDATADVVMRERAAGHDDEMWRREFPLMIRWAFGRRDSDD